MTLAARLAGAQDALLRGDGPNAVRHALNGLSIAPDSPDAAFLLGLAWDPRWFVRSLALAPDHLGAALNLAQALIASGRRPLAARVIRRFAVMVPAEVPALVNLALLSEPATARAWLARAAALGPDDPVVRVNLAAILDRLGLSRAAACEHRRAVVLAPHLALATVNLALACFAAGEMSPAERWHRRTLSLDPHAADAMAGLGAIARGLDRPAEGRGWDRRSLALRPDHVPTLANLSAAAVAIGEAKEGASSRSGRRRSTRRRPAMPASPSPITCRTSDRRKSSLSIAAGRPVSRRSSMRGRPGVRRPAA